MNKMKTITEKVNVNDPETSTVEKAGKIIREGGLVAFPTETVYGLGADALQSEAAAKIYRAKGRPSDNPLIIHIAELQDLDHIIRNIPDVTYNLAAKFWPGPLTMIFQKADCVPNATTGGLDTVAVRMPAHNVALELIRQGGGYIAAPSANTSGRPSPTQASHVREDLDGRIDMILDGGTVGIGLESTIVDLSSKVPVILRPGAITKPMLETVLGEVILDKGLTDTDSKVKPKAPGMKYKHYAPKAQLIIIDGNTENVIKEIKRLAKNYQPEKIGIICTEETKNEYSYGLIKSIGSRMHEESIAKNLYAILREFDQTGVEVIYSEAFETPKMGQAIMNRLLKAAGHQRIQV